MIIIIDLDLQQAVQGFGSKQPAPAITVKSQDTPTLSIYFAKGNVNYDLGVSPGIRFGVFGTGPNALVQQNSFSRVLDAQSRVTYVGYPNFNTTQMLAAIGTQASITCIGEIRYQTSFGTIARTLDIAFTVERSLLSETTLDTTIAAFTTPAVNANITVRINSTAWLSTGLNLAIAAGAGLYQVVSITNTTDFVAQNMGGAGNAASGTVISSGTNVGIAATNVIQTYPDASLLELITRKNAVNGYAGLNASSKLNPAAIPVDNTTINLSGAGNLQLANVVATVGANFTTPASGATVNIAVSSSTGFVVGQWIRIPIAGYYSVTAVPDGTHITIQNLGDLWNAGAGTTITTGAAIVSWTSLGGGGGGAGANAFTTTTASFTQPAVAGTITITVGATAWMSAGQPVFITGGGQYTVSSVTDATHAVVTNLGASGNSAPGATVGSGATVSPSGLNGTNGTNGVNAYTTTAANFTTPAAGASVTVTVGSTAWVSGGQVLFIAGAGYYQVAAVLNATQLSMTNLGTAYGNTSGGSAVSSGASVSASGVIGPAGPIGAQGPAGATGSGSTIYTGSSLQGNGNVATPATLVADIAQGTGAYKVYQRDSSGNSKWDVALLSAADAVSGPGTGEVSHIQAQTSGVLSLKKLKSGPAGSVALTDQGGSTGDILVDVPVDGTTIGVSGGKLVALGGGGGGGAWNPATGASYYDDFTGAWQATTQAYNVNGGAVVPVVYGNNATSKAIGVVVQKPGTGSSPLGSSLIFGIYNNVPIGGLFYTGAGAITYKTRTAFATALGGLPGTGNGTSYRIGLVGLSSAPSGTTPNLANANQICIFEYSPDQNSGQFRVATGTTSPTYVNTSQVVSADTFYDLEIDVNSAGTSIIFIINGTTVATVTTNLPTTFGPMFPVWFVYHTGSTSIDNWQYVDYWSILQATSR